MAGVVPQSTSRRAIEILSPIEIAHAGKFARLLPGLESTYTVDIAFDQAPIAKQSYSFTLSPDNFRTEIGRARTFGFFEEVDQLRKAGLARGGSLDNAVVIKGQEIMNEDGLRYDNEFARHKVLDAVGDLSLAGMPIIGHFHGSCSGHALNNQLLRALFADTSAWRYVDGPIV
jgi:UDP-3-O-[3-hydroxymyristoyl] N-acetylglucosamine deacetylase